MWPGRSTSHLLPAGKEDRDVTQDKARKTYSRDQFGGAGRMNICQRSRKTLTCSVPSLAICMQTGGCGPSQDDVCETGIPSCLTSGEVESLRDSNCLLVLAQGHSPAKNVQRESVSRWYSQGYIPVPGWPMACGSVPPRQVCTPDRRLLKALAYPGSVLKGCTIVDNHGHRAGSKLAASLQGYLLPGRQKVEGHRL